MVKCTPQSLSFVCKWSSWGFSCGPDAKESACNEEDLGLIPGLGRSPGEEKGYPLQHSGLENFMGCIIHGVSKSQTRLSNLVYFWSVSIYTKAVCLCEISLAFHPHTSPNPTTNVSVRKGASGRRHEIRASASVVL